MKMGEKKRKTSKEEKTVVEKCFCAAINIVFVVFFAVVIFDFLAIVLFEPDVAPALKLLAFVAVVPGIISAAVLNVL